MDVGRLRVRCVPGSRKAAAWKAARIAAPWRLGCVDRAFAVQRSRIPCCISVPGEGGQEKFIKN